MRNVWEITGKGESLHTKLFKKGMFTRLNDISFCPSAMPVEDDVSIAHMCILELGKLKV